MFGTRVDDLTRSTCPTYPNLPKCNSGWVQSLYSGHEMDRLDGSSRMTHLTRCQPYSPPFPSLRVLRMFGDGGERHFFLYKSVLRLIAAFSACVPPLIPCPLPSLVSPVVSLTLTHVLAFSSASHIYPVLPISRLSLGDAAEITWAN